MEGRQRASWEGGVGGIGLNLPSGCLWLPFGAVQGGSGQAKGSLKSEIRNPKSEVRSASSAAKASAVASTSAKATADKKAMADRMEDKKSEVARIVR